MYEGSNGRKVASSALGRFASHPDGWNRRTGEQMGNRVSVRLVSECQLVMFAVERHLNTVNWQLANLPKRGKTYTRRLKDTYHHTCIGIENRKQFSID